MPQRTNEPPGKYETPSAMPALVCKSTPKSHIPTSTSRFQVRGRLIFRAPRGSCSTPVVPLLSQGPSESLAPARHGPGPVAAGGRHLLELNFERVIDPLQLTDVPRRLLGRRHEGGLVRTPQLLTLGPGSLHRVLLKQTRRGRGNRDVRRLVTMPEYPKVIHRRAALSLGPLPCGYINTC